MKTKFLCTIGTIMLAAFGIKAYATNYYFSSTQGDDSRSPATAQNSATPWRSLSKLNSFFTSLQPGDHIYFKGGETFYGSITTSKSGTTSLPIIFSSYGTGQATLTGFVSISSWTSIGNGIYESNTLPTGSAVNMVVINGQQYAMGRYPNATSANAGYLTFETHGVNSITDNESVLTNTWANAQLVVRTSYGSIETSKISSISGKTISYSPAFAYTPMDRYGYFVQNDIKTLDQFGEWYYNPSTHKLSVYFGSYSPSASTVQTSAIENLLTIHGSNFVFDGLTFTGANSNALFADWQGTNNVKIKNCNINFSGLDGAALSGTTDFLMDNCLIQNSNSNAIDLYYNNINPTISNTTIKNTGILNGMMKKDIGRRYGIAIFASSGLKAIKNNIFNTGYIGIYFIGNNNLIQNNFIQRFGTTLGDGAAIYSWVGSSNVTYYNRKIIGNILVDGIGAKEGGYSSDPTYNPVEGIYADDNCSNIEILNNTVANCANAGIYVHNARNLTLRSNVFYNNKFQIAFQHDGLGNAISGVTSRLNQLFSKTKSQLVLRLASPNNDFTGIGSFDSNYYCRPILEDKINFTNWFSNKSLYYTLTEWQSLLNQDRHSRRSPFSITDTSAIIFDYNATASNKIVKFIGTYVGLNGVVYSGSATIPPYSSIILLRSATSGTAASVRIIDDVVQAEDLKIKAYPNPSSSYFNVTTSGKANEPMTLRVLDLSGKLIKIVTGVSANSTIQVGGDIARGTYVLELIQGDKKVEQKVLKIF